jgi:hypothetical protein
MQAIENIEKSVSNSIKWYDIVEGIFALVVLIAGGIYLLNYFDLIDFSGGNTSI